MLVYLDYISKARIQKLQLIQDSFNTLHELEIQKNTETQSLQTVLKKKQIETDRMLILKNQRENLLLSLNSDYLSKSKQKERLLLDEKKLAKLVASLQKTDDNSPVEHPNSANLNPKQVINNHQDSLLALKPNTTNSLSNKVFSESQGSLAWPVAGSILEHFGSRRFETPLDGAVINAKEGADIHAVAAGRVVYAEWLRGYGLMIIVDHGHGFMSLYGYNQNLYKKNGERVSAGETLAAVGRSGGRSEASLYFGIRKNGKAINPELWCKQSTNN